MKINKRFLIIFFICVLICTGCGKKSAKLLMTCNNSLDSDIENVFKEEIQVEFYDNNKVKRKVTALIKYDKNKDVTNKNTDENISNESQGNNNEEMDRLARDIAEQIHNNYCNSEIKKDYNCLIDEIENKKIVLKENGITEKVMGIEKKESISGYKKILESKGFKCRKKNS